MSVWQITLHENEHEREWHIKTAERDVANYARVFEAHTVRTIQAADQAVKVLRYEYLEQGNKLDIENLVERGLLYDNVFNLLSIIDANGQLLLSSRGFAPVDLSDREHFRVHKEGKADHLFISKPVLGRVSGKWSLQVTRRIDRADGSFAGVAVASLDPFYFTELYESVNLGQKSVVTLAGEDAIVRARRTGKPGDLGQNIEDGAVMKAARQAPNGIVHTTSIVDGVVRIFAYRTLEHYPLIVMVGLSTQEILAPYESVARHNTTLAVILTVVIVLFIITLLLLNHRLIRQTEHAVRASRVKTQLLSNISHELRTPLNGILGYSELLKEESPEPEHRDFARHIHDSGLHLLSIVNSVLNLNKMDAGLTSTTLAPENLRSIVQHVFHSHVVGAARKGIALYWSVDDAVPETVQTDRMKLVQILNNLVHNAIKFTETGEVSLTIRREGNKLSFAVRDSGCGIPGSDLERIFEEFFQVDGSHSRQTGGAGLGLAIVRQLVRLLGGTLTVQSKPGKGSVFRFYLPLQPDNAPISNSSPDIGCQIK